MSLFLDTSALYALLVGSEKHHDAVLKVFEEAIRDERALYVTSYILLETTALLQHRLGLSPVRDLQRHIVPLLLVEWVSSPLHQRAIARLLRENRRQVSLVDYVSFEFMRTKGMDQALTLDSHFADAGFEALPSRKTVQG